MTNRMVIGERGSEMGVWMSKDGVDVLSAGEDDLLISSNERRLALLMKGIVSLAASPDTENVLFPATLSNVPVVISQFMFTDGFGYVPSYCLVPTGQLPVPHDAIGQVHYTMQPSTSAVLFANNRDYAIGVSYAVMMLQQ